MKNIFGLLICLLLSSCSTVLKYQMNNEKFLTPETKGKFLKGDLGIGYQVVHKVYLVEAFDPIVFNLPATTIDLNTIAVSSAFDLPFELGLFENLDFYTLDSKYGIKFQFLGESELAKSTGYKGAIALAYGYDHPDSSDQNYISSSQTTRTYSTDLKVKSVEASLIIGKRFSPEHLLYSTLFYDYYAYNGVLTSNQFNTISAKGKSFNTALLIGYELTTKENIGLFFKLEGGVAVGQLDNVNTKVSGTIGSSVSLGW